MTDLQKSSQKVQVQGDDHEAGEEGQAEESLSQLFHSLWLEYRSLNNIFGANLQEKLTQLLPQFERIIASIDELDIFSLNEDISDLTLGSIPFLMAHALAGLVASKHFTTREERLVFVEKALHHYKEYDLITTQFGFSQPHRPSREAGMKSLENTMTRRDLLIASQKNERELNLQVDAFLKRLKKDADSIDEDVQREMYTKAITQLLHEVYSDRENLNMELGFLKSGPPPRPNPAKLPPPRKPMIITKDKMQAKVFGAGYPSLPTMSVEEFAEQEMAKINPSQEFKVFNEQRANMARRNPNYRQEEEEKIPSDEDDSDATLYRKRQFDAFKDDNRRGSGNRKGMG